MAEISLPVFEGPLDLLLHLIERDDLDITAVSLVPASEVHSAVSLLAW
jgi:segregation and condensation protein A